MPGLTGLDLTGLVALTRTRLVGGSPLSVIGIKALGDTRQRMTWPGIRTACEGSQRRATYCVNVGQEARPVSFLCYAHPACPAADGRWMDGQTDRRGLDSSYARIQCQCQCQCNVLYPAVPLQLCGLYLVGRGPPDGSRPRDRTASLSALSPNLPRRGSSAPPCSLFALTPSLILSHMAGATGGPAQCRALVPSDKSWLVHSP